MRNLESIVNWRSGAVQVTKPASRLRQEDNFADPNCTAQLASAEKTHDRRLARLLGSDKLIFPRQNSGFTSPHAEQWAEWTREDEAYAAGAQAVDDTARQARRELALQSSERAMGTNGLLDSRIPPVGVTPGSCRTEAVGGQVMVQRPPRHGGGGWSGVGVERAVRGRSEETGPLRRGDRQHRAGWAELGVTHPYVTRKRVVDLDAVVLSLVGVAGGEPGPVLERCG